MSSSSEESSAFIVAFGAFGLDCEGFGATDLGSGLISASLEVCALFGDTPGLGAGLLALGDAAFGVETFYKKHSLVSFCAKG